MKKTNKLISILLVLVMLLSMAPLSVLAAEAPPTVEIGGKTYYELDSADDLDWFAARVNGGNTTINAVLTKDITYNSGTMSASSAGARVWTPIGTYEMPFEGIINGNGYTISGLFCKDPEGSPNLALVSYSVKATIANVAVTNFYFESKHGLVAGLASYAAGSTIYNCYAQGSIYAKDAGAAAAGICAAVFGHSRTEILNCLSDVALKVDDPSDFTVSGLSLRNYIGGIICTGDKNNPVLIQKTVYITDRYNGTIYDEKNSLASHFEIYDSEGMPASKLATGEIAYILGKGWGQKLGTDSIPKIGNSNVVNYGYVSCDVDAQKVYTNSATNPNYPDHYDSETDSDNSCDFCGTNLHTHSFTYSASGDTITAVCENTDGSCTDPEGTLTISAPADLYSDGTTAKEATVENNLVDTSVAISDITYSTADGNAPKTAGTYTASVTVGGATASVQFELVKRSAIAENFVYTAPENLVYDGTAKYATVEVSPEITGVGEISVTYYKDGEAVEPINAGTYTVKVSTADSDKYYAINDVELASFTISKKAVTVTATDALKIYGEADPEDFSFSYNLLYPQYKLNGQPARTPGENVGVYEIGQGTITQENNPNYDITFISGKFTIEPDKSRIEGLTIDTVKSTDKESVEYVYNQLENAVKDLAGEDKILEWNTLQAYCAAMRQRIEIVENGLAGYKEKTTEYNIDTVTSDNADTLKSFDYEVGQFYFEHRYNLTEEETKEFDDILAEITALRSRISDVADEIARIETAINAYDKATVKSTDKADIEQLKADIKALTDGDNITEDEKAALEEADKAIDELVEKLAEVAEEIERADEAVKSYDEDTVKSSDKEDLAQLKDDIQALIDSDNTIENEKTVLGDMIKDIEAFEDKIAETEAQLEKIAGIENGYNPETATSDDKAAIEETIAEIEAVNPDNLTDEQKAEYEEIKVSLEALLEEIEEASKAVTDIGAQLEMFDENRVTIFWEDEIEALKAKIDELLADENMGEAEKAKLGEYKAQAEKLMEIINTPKEYFSVRFFYLIWDCFTWKYSGILWLFSKIFGC